MSLADLASAAADLVPPDGRALLGIAGVPGAGKSTLAEALVTELAGRYGPGFVAHVPMDGYHLADVQLDRLGLRDRKGVPETFDAEGYAALLGRLREDTARDVYAPGFERELEQPLAGAMVVPAGTRLVVTEGNYLLLDEPRWHETRARLDAVWWVETEETVRMDRLVARHVESGKEQDAAVAWIGAVDEGNADLVRPGRAVADLVVVNGTDGWRTA
ncbi:nucleoside/nucleotide kinase family protein [Phycicoccus sp. CSK15P-2]|uniref:nucleoside/nucleotide kinase family protein n=1 Tax=Phycicoccus sp. CSK15P-2 TaxID=2807627 RepID=UPI00194E54A7|nr:nucleoside/nucleotide kinase family protein [Phycicoccus sp. CSK15P-2]MBM6405270.1 nucleoside/nucleotide kinase family protein [Phycicoccus sp. CSK15P-2]